ncbi:MAG TPA: hypothetical protein VKA70_06175 [Blastocatellia bacterium]|nr:hypothetical protein [Blastocatellia bacterium]
MKVITIVALLVVSLPGAYAQSRAMRRASPVKAVSTAQSPAPVLPIRRVVLYSNGVAYFERRGTITGQAEINLPFKQSQVDDVLKSLVVLDLGRGRIGAVSYNSSAPPSARLNEIPFSIDAATEQEESSPAGGLAAVLTQLQGAHVIVTTQSRSVRGAVLTVEERKSQIDANKPPLVTNLLVIASDNGELSSFDLSEVRSIRLLDEGAWQDISEFARATASTRRRDAKTIVVTSTGEGVRELAVSYTVAAPIWKTTYRVVLDDTGKPFFQGWAIVDNVGDEDWTGVELSLVSGTPVSFIQPLQQPLYRHRPVIPIPEDLALEPQVHDTGSYAPGGIPGGMAGGVGAGSGSGVGPGAGSGMAGAAPPLADAAAPSAGPRTSISDAITSEESGVKTAATGKKVGDLFEYRIDQPVTLRRDRSALIPILQMRMEGERVSIYNEAARKDRPMSGIRLKNTSPLTLEDGSMTVIEGEAYAGEALIERLKPEEERFISFALDLGTLVTARSKIDREPAVLVRASNGVLQAHYYQTDKKVYTITNQTDRPRVVYVEHPVREKWVLSDKTQKPAETTATLYRFRVEVPAQETIEFPVTERLPLMDSYALSNLTPDDIKLFVARRYIDEETHAALEKIMEIKARIAALDRRLASIEREAAEIAADQGRLRENIKALKDTAETRQLIARYVAKAGEQETRMEQIAAERRAIAADRAKVQNELDDAIRSLALNRKLS